MIIVVILAALAIIYLLVKVENLETTRDNLEFEIEVLNDKLEDKKKETSMLRVHRIGGDYLDFNAESIRFVKGNFNLYDDTDRLISIIPEQYVKFIIRVRDGVENVIYINE